MNVEILWSNFLNQIKDELTSLSYNTWFADTMLYKLDNGKAYIIVPMPIHKKHLIDNYSQLITTKLADITGSNYELNLLLKEEIENEVKDKANVREEILVEENINASNYKLNSNLNSKYLFDNFIVGNSNKFAHAAALSVAENPGSMYNPLFLYGNSGLGKTHLMHAIGNFIVENLNKKVLYVTSEQFRQDFVKANRKDDKGTNFNYIDFFKNKYRNIDVLIIDDIQFLGGANQSQQEFFHTFNNLYNDSKQIIISSDRSPEDLKLLEDRLRTRFCWGLTVNIFPPEFALRTEILKKKIIAGNFEQDIPDEVVEYIASNIGPDVRQLEGSVTRLIAYSAIMGGEKITLDLAIEALKDFISKGIGEKNDVHRIQKIVSEYFQISVEDIRSKKRSSNISFPRQIAMYLCRTMTNESFPKIGTEFGGKDHSTVMHSVEKIETEIKNNLKRLLLIPEATVRSSFAISEVENNNSILPQDNKEEILNLTLEENEQFTIKDEDISYNEKSPVIEQTKLEENIEQTVYKIKRMVPKGIVYETYIIAENEEGMFIIDQHAAAERINYELCLNSLLNKEVAKINLLIPLTLEFPTNEYLIIKNNLPLLESIGFEVEEFGINTFLIRTHPTFLKDDRIKDDILKIFQLVAVNEKFDREKFIDHTAATMACRMSIKGNDYIDLTEAQYLLDTLCKCNNPFNCPHGRPTIITYTKYELEKMFKRVMD